MASLPPGGGIQASDADDAAFAAFALEAAIAAGEAILPHFRAPLDVEDKGGARGYDPVTEADRAAEAVIRAAITSRYPDHGIHGEEHGRLQGRSRFTWVVDPIDGTRSFIVGHLHWATLIARGGDASAVRRRVVCRGERHQHVDARRRASRSAHAPLPADRRCRRRHDRSAPFQE